jgi:hypothetical protein
MNMISSCFASLLKMTSLAVVAFGLTLTPAFIESAPAASAVLNDQLSGSTWKGTEDLPAPYGPLTFEFKADGKVVMIDGRSTVQGNYRIEGNTVGMSFPGSSGYVGVINGNSMTGLAKDDNRTWAFRVTKS